MTGNEYRKAREALNLSQTELASILDIGWRTVQRIEKDGCSSVMDRAMNDLANEWRPIETAPKTRGAYGPEFIAAQGGIDWLQHMVRYNAHGALVSAWDHKPIAKHELDPTCWRPYPAPPTNDLKREMEA